MPKSFDHSRVFKALSNPYRLEIFFSIYHNEGKVRELKSCFLSDLTGQFKIGAPTISHHLKELVKAGLIQTEKQGKFVLCKVNEDMIEQIKNIFNKPNLGK
jgi:ArsR family transcriptional regulator, arsenate/arsenite/antimonite-responsive transcriptional repressor